MCCEKLPNIIANPVTTNGTIQVQMQKIGLNYHDTYMQVNQNDPPAVAFKKMS